MTPSPFQIGQAIGTNVGQVQERQTDLTAIDQILSQAGQSGDQQVMDTAMNQILSRVSPQRQQSALDILQKRKKTLEISQKSAEDQRRQEQKREIYREKGVDPRLADLSPSEAKPFIDLELQSKEDTGQLQKTFNRISELSKDVGATSTLGKYFSSKTREDIAEFNTLQASIESKLTDLVSKGRLTDTRFNYILTLLPKSSDTQATIRGKLKALATQLDLENPLEQSLEKNSDQESTDQQTAQLPTSRLSEIFL